MFYAVPCYVLMYYPKIRLDIILDAALDYIRLHCNRNAKLDEVA